MNSSAPKQVTPNIENQAGISKVVGRYNRKKVRGMITLKGANSCPEHKKKEKGKPMKMINNSKRSSVNVSAYQGNPSK